ncbi:Fic family protein [Candidatus Paracaedibacter symbiosus]|uniref:Fic family protein n=1 Tax=Candidatus Paracaedibacter symbiosus TaxID=244582 RepID=UPI000509BD41|nr:Fic family protein [Candidatus Paracaedibacter symbiosus]
MSYIPPFKITPLILKNSQKISRELGIIFGRKIAEIPLKLRRENNIKSIQASLAIEGNTLTLNQITDILEGKRVIGPPKDILEVKNALSLYGNLKIFDPLKINDLLQAHTILMENLTDENGKWRSGAVGIFKGKEVSHVAPPAKRVPELMHDLFDFLVKNKEISWIIKACIFHYELEFIHPFADGNGRIGRLWQQLILMKEDPLFEYIPLEVLVKDNQAEYYQALGESDRLGESTPFIEFSLNIIDAALISYSQMPPPLPKDSFSRLNYAKSRILKEWFSRKNYIEIHKDISTSTASRDLLFGIEKGILKSRGRKNQLHYYFLNE